MKLSTFVTVSAACLAVASGAQAQQSDQAYCNKVHERAIADKILAFSPGVELDAIKYPSATGSSVPFVGPIVGDGYQARASLIWNGIAAYRGTKIVGIADADCAYHSIQMEAQNLVEQAADIGKAQALAAIFDYLNDNRPEWQDIVAREEKRVRAGNLTLSDLTIIRTSASTLETKLVESQGQLVALRAKDYVKQKHSVQQIVIRLQSAAMELEKRESEMRMLDPWSLTINGGVVPPMQQGTSTQWFGTVSLGYNFGGLVRGARENNYLAARQEELRHARYEMADILRRITDGEVANFMDATNRIDVLKHRLNDLQGTRKELAAHPEASSAANLLALVDLQIMDVRSDLIFVEALQKQLAAWK